MNTKALGTSIAAALCVCLLTLPVYRTYGKYREENVSRFGELPSKAVQALVLEYAGIAADLLFLKTMTFMGMKIGAHGEPLPEEWHLIDAMLNLITDIDGRFPDPYLFAETMLVWQAGMIEQANRLLKKATVQRPDDYRAWYFLGFNEFYFRKDSKTAAQYLRKAAQFPDCPAYIQGLATRLSLYGNETKLAIVMLEKLLEETKDENIRKYLSKRLTALDAIYLLEEKVKEYRRLHGSLPGSLDELIRTGVLKDVPVDPYGGNWFIMPNGRVYSSSKLVMEKKEPKE